MDSAYRSDVTDRQTFSQTDLLQIDRKIAQEADKNTLGRADRNLDKGCIVYKLYLFYSFH